MSDVAARAGVSRTTASYILNGRSAEMRISADAVDRVGHAVEDLGYRPNRTARSLRTAETRTVGVVSDHVASGQFAGRMLTGASSAARALDHLLVIGETDGDPLLEQVLVDQMLDQGVDGIVYATLWHREVTPPAGLSQTATVLLNCVDADRRLPSVVPDEQGGGRSAATAVLGVAGPIVVVGDEREQGTRAGSLRLAGLAERLAEAGRAVAEVLACEWSVAATREGLGAWLDDGGEVGAVIAMNDRVAMGAYQALAARGCEVPSDISVVSFDGSDLAGWLSPPVTSIGLPFADLGATAVRTLLGHAPPPTEQRLPMPVVGGGSVRVRPDTPRGARTR